MLSQQGGGVTASGIKMTSNDAFSSGVDCHDRFHCLMKNVPLFITALYK